MLIIFLKAPIPGFVKTRLSFEFGDEGACEIYKKLTANILTSAQNCENDITLFYYPADGKKIITDWLGQKYTMRLQEGDDLGERMKNAFIDTFLTGIKKVVLIGTDIPDLDESTINKAYQKLDSHDCVIGPSIDGGYYLIGFTKEGFNQNVFNNIAWSTNSVLNRTLSILDINNLNYTLLEFKNDIDTPEDYRGFFTDE